jgi:hypothetical protein
LTGTLVFVVTLKVKEWKRKALIIRIGEQLTKTSEGDREREKEREKSLLTADVRPRSLHEQRSKSRMKRWIRVEIRFSFADMLKTVIAFFTLEESTDVQHFLALTRRRLDALQDLRCRFIFGTTVAPGDTVAHGESALQTTCTTSN